jgi:hypothetical protein
MFYFLFKGWNLRSKFICGNLQVFNRSSQRIDFDSCCFLGGLLSYQFGFQVSKGPSSRVLNPRNNAEGHELFFVRQKIAGCSVQNMFMHEQVESTKD